VKVAKGFSNELYRKSSFIHVEMKEIVKLILLLVIDVSIADFRNVSPKEC